MELALTEAEEKLLKTISAVAGAAQLEAYVVGGFVRDKLLQRPTKDIDIVCVGDALTLAHAVADTFSPKPKVSVFKNFGTAQFKTGAGLDIEFVGARKESYQLQSRKPAVLPGTLRDDQLRRDFTINAMALSLNRENYGQLVDPFDGVAHLKQGLIKTPQDPAQTFSDDPLRMMRAVRFATQLQFHIFPATFAAIKLAAERIKIVSQERITDELHKIMKADKPSVGFRLLRDSGLLSFILPQLEALAGAAFVDGVGHKDNFYHTLQVVDNTAARSESLWLRWAALLHDIGKPATKKFEDGGWTFHGHEVVGGRMVPKIFGMLKLPQGEPQKYVKKLVELHMRPIALTKDNITDSAIRRLLVDAGEDFEDLMQLCESDITSKNKTKVSRYLENFNVVKQRCAEVEETDRMRAWQPPITGEAIMKTFGIGPSKNVGIIKEAVRNAILDGEIPNNYEAAFNYMLQKGADAGLKPVA